MTHPSDARPGLGPGTIAERANQALLMLADSMDQKKSEAELNAIAAACTRAEKLASSLQTGADVGAKLEALGVQYTAPAGSPRAAKAIRDLRSAATRAADPSQDLTERLRSGAVQEALKAGDATLKAMEQALANAADAERLSLAPPDLDAPVATMPGNESLQIRVGRIQGLLVQRFNGQVGDLPTMVARWRSAAMEWTAVRDEMARTIADLPPEIKAFVEASATGDGAPWSMVTAAVREWLDADSHGDGYGVRKW